MIEILLIAGPFIVGTMIISAFVSAVLSAPRAKRPFGIRVLTASVLGPVLFFALSILIGVVGSSIGFGNSQPALDEWQLMLGACASLAIVVGLPASLVASLLFDRWFGNSIQ